VYPRYTSTVVLDRLLKGKDARAGSIVPVIEQPDSVSDHWSCGVVGLTFTRRRVFILNRGESLKLSTADRLRG
jgi:hypothetical protein